MCMRSRSSQLTGFSDPAVVPTNEQPQRGLSSDSGAPEAAMEVVTSAMIAQPRRTGRQREAIEVMRILPVEWAVKKAGG